MPMFVRGLKALINMSVFASVPIWIIEIPEHLETLEMYNEAVHMESYSLLVALKAKFWYSEDVNKYPI